MAYDVVLKLIVFSGSVKRI